MGVEFMTIELSIKSNKWNLCYIYRPPSVNGKVFCDFLCHVCEAFIIDGNICLFFGDMNCDLSSRNCLSDICDVFGLTNLVIQPTCFKSDIPTLLDMSCAWVDLSRRFPLLSRIIALRSYTVPSCLLILRTYGSDGDGDHQERFLTVWFSLDFIDFETVFTVVPGAVLDFGDGGISANANNPSPLSPRGHKVWQTIDT